MSFERIIGFRMKKQVIYIHGGSSFSEYGNFLKNLQTVPLRDLPGSDEESIRHWKKDLAKDLGDDYEVFKPAMPNARNARYIEWKIWFERYLSLVEKEVILVGHSLGGMFLAKYLSEEVLLVQVSQLYILAAPSGDYLADGEDCKEFLFSGEKLSGLDENFIKNIHIWHSEDDFVVPVSELKWFRRYLPEAQYRVFTDKNHFLGPELPELALEISRNS